MSGIVLYAILAVAAIGAFVGWQNMKKGAAWGQPVTILCAIVAIVVGLYNALTNSGMVGGGNASSQAREVEFAKIQTRKLGAYLKEKYNGKTAILLKDPYLTEDSPTIIGLKEGIEGAITITEELSPTPPKSNLQVGPDGGPGPGDMLEPMETWFTVKELDKMLKGKKADLIITTIGLPMGTRFTAKDWSLPCLKGRKVVFAGGSVYEYAAPIASGLVVAAVTYRPDAEYDDKPVPRDPEEAFNKRYLLITTENVRSLPNAKEIFR